MILLGLRQLSDVMQPPDSYKLEAQQRTQQLLHQQHNLLQDCAAQAAIRAKLAARCQGRYTQIVAARRSRHAATIHNAIMTWQR